MKIRPPVDTDAADIAGLLGELGYPCRPDDVVPRLEALRSEATSTGAWVAEFGSRVAGLATTRAFASVHVAVPVVWLTVLVVTSEARGQGIGRALVGEAERWARAMGAHRLSLTSGVQRQEAHEFYRRLGYTQTGIRLAKIF